MFSNVAKIEGILSDMEVGLSNPPDDTFFEQIVHLRDLAVSNWDYARPDDVETEELFELRDRIVSIEQRILNLAAQVPTHSVDSIRLKLLLWMLERHLPLKPGEQETPSDRLIASVFEDLTAISTGDSVTGALNPTALKTAR